MRQRMLVLVVAVSSCGCEPQFLGSKDQPNECGSCLVRLGPVAHVDSGVCLIPSSACS